MFASIRSRLILIAVLAAISIWQLIPSTVQRTQVIDGRSVEVTDTVYHPSLGLDLQGGMHLALELDESKRVSTDKKRDLGLALTVLRKRIDEFGVTEPLIQQVGDNRIIVELAGQSDPDRAKGIVQRAAFLEFMITDKSGQFERALPAMDRVARRLGITAGPGAAPSAPSAVQQLLQGDSASDSAGTDSTAAPGDSAAAGDTTTLATGGVLESLVRPSSEAGFAPIPGEFVVPEGAWPRVDSILSLPEIQRLIPRGITFRWLSQSQVAGTQSYRLLYALEDKPIITGERLVDAQASLDQTTQGSVVTFQLDRAGGRQFGRETAAHVGDYMAILLDGRVQGRPPIIQSQITRNGQITLGSRPIQEAQDLALTLKAGALPIPLKIVDERQVGPSLGADSIRAGLTAGIVGMLLVIVIMAGYYRLSGLLAILALALYVLFAMGGLAMIDATLTLPGLAGLVLSIGIAVDANVLIFERIREELLLGKTVRLSVDEGFRHAMSAIIDSNVSTVLTALFLFQFGTGPVKGFAVTLIMGIIASMITAIFVTRTFFMIWLDRRPAMSTLSI